MATKTKHLQLYKPAKNEYYDVDRDQNENFDKIDAKFGEVDNGLKEKLNKGSYNGDAGDLKREIDGKEPAFSKNSGFNKEKTDDYNGNDTNKLFTQKGANNLYLNSTTSNGFIPVTNGTFGDFVDKVKPGTYSVQSGEQFTQFNFPTIDGKFPYVFGRLEVAYEGLHGCTIKYTPDAGAMSQTNYYFSELILSIYNFKNNRTTSFDDVTDKWIILWNNKTFSPESKVNKSGDTITGSLNIIIEENGGVNFSGRGNNGGVGHNVDGQYVYLYNRVSNKAIKLYNNGNAEYPANNLETPDKELILATNYLFKNSLINRGNIREFDGTYGDFAKKYPAGIYKVHNETEIIKKLLPSNVYSYGILEVKYNSTVCSLVYRADYTGVSYTYTEFNFNNTPQKTFNKELWKNLNAIDKVEDIRLSGNIKIQTWDKRVDTYVSGRVMTGIYKDDTDYNIDGVYYASLQKKINGKWYTIVTE